MKSPRLSLGLPRSPVFPRSPTLPNAIVSRENREAALRERGLLPPRKDLSEQEREADEKLGLAVSAMGNDEGDALSAATKIKEEWLALNRRISADSSVESHPGVYPKVLSTPNFGAMSMPALTPHRSSDAESATFDSPLTGRPSFSSSTALPLSNASQLATLQEEPIQPSNTESTTRGLGQEIYLESDSAPPIIITPVEDTFPPPMLVDSPISDSFPSLSPPPPPPQKENTHSACPPPGPRRRTTDSSDRRRRSFGPTLSRFGTSSLSNLRRSVVGSIRSHVVVPPSPTLPSHLGNADGDLDAGGHTLRAALSPTIHSRGSILLETKEIMDAESRRLSEMAFLD
ncbi:hypothetical protein BV22DRAFT_77858 [Leucogyrophana mollusca]|uniref:Uncharacterized protein n=1 Tax=Leucogyrophana mollusca TaxID=85980 RepID=A0ACB8BWX6_9AGAM|nr:hypothetical protein BV22DRAFT_77858 [Leucogyrophana mollusca]